MELLIRLHPDKPRSSIPTYKEITAFAFAYQDDDPHRGKKSDLWITCCAPYREEPDDSSFSNLDVDDSSMVEFVKDKLTIRIGHYYAHVWNYRNGKNAAIVENNRVQFYVRWSVETIHALNTSAYTQHAIYSRKNGTLPELFATDYVFSYVLAEYNAIISSDAHFPDGERYWKRLVRIALERKHPVFILENMRKATTLTELRQLEGLWGKTETHKNLRIVIMKG